MVRVVGKEGALRAGVCGNCSSGMDGSKKINEVISRAWKCLLLCRSSILGEAFEQERARQKKRGGGEGGKVFQEVY